MKRSNRAFTLAVALVSALSLETIVTEPALCATFNYTTFSTETTFTQNPTLINDTPYDGSFTNTVSFGSFQLKFSGFFSVVSGTLGKAISVRAVQKNPVDRTLLGEDGIAQIQYLAQPQDVASVPGNIRVFPPNLTEYDFIFIPAPVAARLGEPTDLRLGWRASKVPEPNLIAALGVISLGFFCLKKKLPLHNIR